jgi:uncharacterized membrane protein YfcA
MLLAIVYGAVVGVALGLTGGGGSILGVPLLVLALGVLPADAVAMSLVSVAATALVGATQSLRHGLIVWQPSLIFAAGGMLSAPAGTSAARHLPQDALVAAFALLAVTVGSLMWRAARRNPAQASAVRAVALAPGSGPVCVLAPDGQLRFTAPCAAVLAGIGVGTGFLSGLLGVGGGFLIVPALVVLGGVPMRQAVGTSLVVIAMNTLAGYGGYHGTVDVPWMIVLQFAGVAAAGILVGSVMLKRVPQQMLKRAFAVLLLLIGALILWQNRSLV